MEISAILDTMMRGDIPAHTNDRELLRHFAEQICIALKIENDTTREQLKDIKRNLSAAYMFHKDGDLFSAGAACHGAYANAVALLEKYSPSDGESK